MTAAFPDRSSSSMTTARIHPSETTRPLIRHRSGGDSSGRASSSPAALRYTVWKRSSIGFQGTDGFSVYDAAGALAFRVDNYSRRRKIFVGELLLMDGQGSPLLALRPQVRRVIHPSLANFFKKRFPPLYYENKAYIVQFNIESKAATP
ncbi:protein LURP-one-related 5-like [Panicum miliaceum]|uniref:Protein LURP-one-related 5-like n=1 Tax=Panicum miliaceum TaxID=4540 RepID=A0A3L6PKU7_PANMI|nr:protein LURP-one-related 5-like [Panicum miliaceum]